MSRSAARMLAAGLVAGGFTCLVMLTFRLDAGGVVLLGLGVGCVVTATWINTVTGAPPPAGEPDQAGTGGPGV